MRFSPMHKACMLGCLLAPMLPLPSQATTSSEPAPEATLVSQFLVNDAPEKAVEAALPLARQGNAEAQFIVGLLSDLGAGLRINHTEATDWLGKAAAQGHRPAAAFLAWKYNSGFGVTAPDANLAAALANNAGNAPITLDPATARWIEFSEGKCLPNFKRALYWMTEHASDGNVPAMFNLIEAYTTGPWTQMDPVQRAYWIQKAAATGNPEAQFASAIMLETEAKNPDPSEVVRLCRLSADQGYLPALNHLSALLRRNLPGLPANPAESFRLSTLGAQAGDAEAQSNLAYMYLNGIGTPVDVDKAFTSFKAAALQGHVYSMAALGQILSQPDFPGKDYKASMDWLRKAADQGSSIGMRGVAVLYIEGLGVPQDFKAAFEWYEKAAKAGDSFSQQKVGYLFRNGVGTTKDNEKAVVWFKIASDNGEILGDANLGYHYLKALGTDFDAAKAFAHLSRALVVLNDPWTSQNLVSLCTATEPELRAKVGQLLVRDAFRGDYSGVQGSLPETIAEGFAALAARTPEEEQAFRLFMAQLAQWHRPASTPLLSLHHLLGLGVPYDLAKGRLYAIEANTYNPAAGEAFLALADVFSATTEEERKPALDALLALAQKGNRHAGVLYTMLSVSRDNPCTALITTLRAAEAAVPPSWTLVDMNDYPTDVQFDPLPTITPEALAAEAEKRAAAGPNTGPSVIFRVSPDFPWLLRQFQVEGEAQIQVQVGTDGTPKSIKVTKASHPLFGLAAQKALEHWRFAPMRKNGVAVESKVSIPVVFNQHNDQAPKALISNAPQAAK